MDSHWKRLEKGNRVIVGQTLEEIFSACLQYFNWCDSNPLYKSELVKNGQLAGQVINVAVPRPYNLDALCIHTGLTKEYIFEGLKNADDNYRMLCNKVMEIIAAQTYENSMVGLFNAPMGAKKLGLNNIPETEKASPKIEINVLNYENSPKLLSQEPKEQK